MRWRSVSTLSSTLDLEELAEDEEDQEGEREERQDEVVGDHRREPGHVLVGRRGARTRAMPRTKRARTAGRSAPGSEFATRARRPCVPPPAPGWRGARRWSRPPRPRSPRPRRGPRARAGPVRPPRAAARARARSAALAGEGERAWAPARLRLGAGPVACRRLRRPGAGDCAIPASRWGGCRRSRRRRVRSSRQRSSCTYSTASRQSRAPPRNGEAGGGVGRGPQGRHRHESTLA